MFGYHDISFTTSVKKNKKSTNQINTKDFISGLSILDMIFNLGYEKVEKILKEKIV